MGASPLWPPFLTLVGLGFAGVLGGNLYPVWRTMPKVRGLGQNGTVSANRSNLSAMGEENTRQGQILFDRVHNVGI